MFLFGCFWRIEVLAVQICKAVGANAIGIISDDDKIPFVKELGAVGVLNRKFLTVLVSYQMLKTKQNIVTLSKM